MTFHTGHDHSLVETLPDGTEVYECCECPGRPQFAITPDGSYIEVEERWRREPE